MPMRRRVALHVFGALAYVAALTFGFIGLIFVAIVTSFQGDAPTTADRIHLWIGLLIVSLMVSSVPVLIGVIARGMNTAALPWFAIAVITLLYTVAIALNSQPVPGMTGM